MLNISFDFDEISKKVTNMKVEEQKADTYKGDVAVLDNKLVFSENALSLLDTKPGDRLDINYIQKSNTLTIPLIGKSGVFNDPEAGNKLTKSNTLSFKGSQRYTLLEYGTHFNLIKYSSKPGTFELVKVEEVQQFTVQSDEKIQQDSNNINIDDFSYEQTNALKSELQTQIDELPF